MWIRALGRLWLPMVWLVLVGLWMATDMQATPQGQVDFPASHDWRKPQDWLKPIALAPQRLRETVIDPGEALGSIHCTNNQRCWAVGNGGTILNTTDAGRSWQTQSSGTTEELFSINFHSNGQHGWAVGRGGTILATADAGRSWQAQSSGTTETLFSVTFQANGQRGWAVGNGGTILTTTDAGRSWQKQSSGTTQRLTSVNVLADGQRGWAVGAGGTILVTTDAGRTWRAQASGTKKYLLTDLTQGWGESLQSGGRRCGWG